MDLTIAGLVFVSAVLHPLREILIKGNTFPEAAYLAITMLWVVFAGIHAVLLGVDPWSVAPVWPLVLFSCLGLFLGIVMYGRPHSQVIQETPRR